MKQKRIFYFTPDFNGTVGGIKVLYNHVDILNEMGYEAYILHSKKGFRCTWFQNSTPIVYYNSKLKIEKEDYIVFPEIYFHLLTDLRLTLRDFFRKLLGHKLDYISARKLLVNSAHKVLFNQNSYHSFLDIELKYLEGRLINNFDAIFSISEQNKKYIEFSFPNQKVHRVQWMINDHIFNLEINKKKKICFMPRKNPQHIKQVLAILKSRNRLENFEFVAIEGKSESEVASIFKESLMFLSFGYPEGLPLPPAEAMACGCIVVGYHGGGGEEYFNNNYCYPIPFGEIIQFVMKIEEVALLFENDPEGLKMKMRNASENILNTYSKEAEKKRLEEVWAKL